MDVARSNEDRYREEMRRQLRAATGAQCEGCNDASNYLDTNFGTSSAASLLNGSPLDLARLRLASLSDMQRGRLDQMFHSLISQHHFGYPLFGERALSIRYSMSDTDTNGKSATLSDAAIWREVVKGVPGPHDMCLKVMAPNPHTGTCDMIIFRSSAVEKVINRYSDRLARVFPHGQQLAPRIREILTNSNSLDRTRVEIRNLAFGPPSERSDELVLGLLLGFGWVSSFQFALLQGAASDSRRERHPRPSKHAEQMIADEFESWPPETQTLRVPAVAPVKFRRNIYDQESIELSNAREKTRDEIAQVLSSGDRLETIVARLFEPLPRGMLDMTLPRKRY